jgi:hypothetical protein
MGQVLHGSARTTEAVRRTIQLHQESVRALARRYGVSPTTIQKWRKRKTTADAPMRPKEIRSTVLTLEEEAIIVAFRKAHAPAAGRLPLQPAADHPAPHSLVPAPLPGTTWNQPVAGDRWRQAGQAALRQLPDRLLPPRHRRGPHRAGPPLSVRRHQRSADG